MVLWLQYATTYSALFQHVPTHHYVIHIHSSSCDEIETPHRVEPHIAKLTIVDAQLTWLRLANMFFEGCNA